MMVSAKPNGSKLPLRTSSKNNFAINANINVGTLAATTNKELLDNGCIIIVASCLRYTITTAARVPKCSITE